ncbi:YARHG domain-containing protein [Fimbriimonas ginsengisoli]|uniref:YARHG domain-containing protein n=1 Tax=Fimbriimonas ginsengisoli TaxID=1005039 RepID=UPI00046C98D6|nr:YARHG domain-containing protein [Fimbriimonas ginsengisoli]
MAATVQRKYTKHPLLASLFLFVVPCAFAQDPYPALHRLESFDFKNRLLTKADLDRLNKEDNPMGDDEVASIVLLRGVVFGKHGRIFHEPKIQDFLKKRPWYRPDPKFSNAELNDTERKNIDLIREAESHNHWRIQPGDLRFWQTKRFDKKLSADQGYSIADLRIMQAEIEAIHGRTFPGEPLLQKYFDERYWYKPDPSYRASSLSKIERENLAALKTVEQKIRGTTFVPADVMTYADKPIPEKALHNLSLYELRVTRNAIYAMRGRRFKTPWLREYFANVEWYSPLPEGQNEKLTATDSENLKTIVKLEQRLHDDLTQKPIPHQRLTGLFVEDLRKLANEIPARHGKVFADRALRNYFSSLPWYKPNPRFTLKSLSKQEKENYEFLLLAAKNTTKQFAMEEG